jgi:replicative DNA helicase
MDGDIDFARAHGLGQGEAVAAAPPMPHSLEAEQAILGVLLYDNAAYERLPDGLTAAHFYEPFHLKLYDLAEAWIRAGRLFEPVLLDEVLRGDPRYDELGGLRYLADLVDRAPPAANAADYARSVMDNALRRDLMRLGSDLTVAGADFGKPATEHLETVEQALFGLAENKTQTGGFATFGEALDGFVAHATEAYSRDGGIGGIPTDLIDLDQKVGGLHPSDLIVLAGRPSMGKTALATNIAFNVAKAYAYEVQPDGTRKTTRGGIVGFYSLEMSKDQLAGRILSEVSGVPGDRIRKGEIDASELGRIRDAAREIRNCPLHIDDGGGTSIAKITARARRLKRTVGLDLVVVDYLQLATGTGKSQGQGRVQEVSEITGGLKALAKDLGVPVIALSQLSRKVEERDDKRPQMSDLRESGSIEQDADMVWFVYREAYYVGRAEPKPNSPERLNWEEEMDRLAGLAEVIIAKQRHGPIGTVKLSFNGDTTSFGNLARDHYFHARNPAGDE